MEINIKTIHNGSFVLSSSSTITLEQLKQQLYLEHDCPEPDEQRLVYKQRLLTQEDAQLQQLGITDGDYVVVLQSLKDRRPPKFESTPAPTAAAIRSAITDEARQRGIEHTLREERPAPAAARRSLVLPSELLNAADDHLLQLLEQALDGRLMGGMSIGGSSGEDATQSGDGEAEEDEEEGEVQVPEPSAANIAAITDMGFTAPLARKALLLARNNLQLALEWVFDHSTDPAAEEPISQEQLRQLYGRRRRGPRSAAGSTAIAAAASVVPQEAVMSQLTEMGFDAAEAQQALAQVGPHLEMAVSYLLGHGLAAAMGASGPQAAHAANPVGGHPAAGAAGPSAGHGAVVQEQAAASPMPDGEAAGNDTDEDEYEDAAEVDEREANHHVDEGEDGDDDDDVDEDGDEDDDDDDDYDLDDDGLPLHLGQALGTIDLEGLGSADMEQLLQGGGIQDLIGNHLLMSAAAGGVDASQGPSLLRLMEAPGLLQHIMMEAAQQGSGSAVAGQAEAGNDSDEDAYADAEEGNSPQTPEHGSASRSSPGRDSSQGNQ